MAPKTRYVDNHGVNIAYQVSGEGPLDLVCVPGFISHLELEWTNPWQVAYFQGLMRFSRLIRFDKRGTGLSDPVPGVPTLEDRMDDVRAVMDAVGVERAALLGLSEGGAMAALFAATYPERVSALILYGSFACGGAIPEEGGIRADNYPAIIDMIGDWGEGRIIELFAPSVVKDEATLKLMGTFERSAASPGMARALIDAANEIDVRDVLPSIQAPTLVLHRTEELVVPVEASRYMARTIPGARLVELPGIDHVPWVGHFQPIVDELEEFLTGVRHFHEPDRVLTTVLFTDIVGSTERAADLGDARWRELLEQHDELARREIESFRGRVVKSLGDGMLATFDGPARAVRCAESIGRSMDSLGLGVRAGVHTGECEAMGDDLGGLAVHIGSRVSAMAAPGEVLVSSTVKDLVVGSGLGFADAGEHELKGVPGKWRLFRLTDLESGGHAIPSAAHHMTRRDRAAVTMARRAPGAMRILTRRTVKGRTAE
jgi:pimeloyl-ACP methyl ester carboxylesterase/class 3 adenylate cyclase